MYLIITMRIMFVSLNLSLPCHEWKTPPPSPLGGEILADVIKGKKYENAKNKKGENVKEKEEKGR